MKRRNAVLLTLDSTGSHALQKQQPMPGMQLQQLHGLRTVCHSVPDS
jgi:hypothetical protein